MRQGLFNGVSGATSLDDGSKDRGLVGPGEACAQVSKKVARIHAVESVEHALHAKLQVKSVHSRLLPWKSRSIGISHH